MDDVNAAIANQANITAFNLAAMFLTVDARLSSVGVNINAAVNAAVIQQTTSFTLLASSLNLTLRSYIAQSTADLQTNFTSEISNIRRDMAIETANRTLEDNAEISARISAIAPLATISALNSAVAPLATVSALNLAVAPLATVSALNSAIAPLATVSALNSAVAPLATVSALNSAIAPLATVSALNASVIAANASCSDAVLAAIVPLNAPLNTEINGRIAAVGAVNASLNAEITARIAAVAALNASIPNPGSIQTPATWCGEISAAKPSGTYYIQYPGTPVTLVYWYITTCMYYTMCHVHAIFFLCCCCFFFF